jgi:hypothetical protein
LRNRPQAEGPREKMLKPCQTVPFCATTQYFGRTPTAPRWNGGLEILRTIESAMESVQFCSVVFSLKANAADAGRGIAAPGRTKFTQLNTQADET